MTVRKPRVWWHPDQTAHACLRRYDRSDAKTVPSNRTASAHYDSPVNGAIRRSGPAVQCNRLMFLARALRRRKSRVCNARTCLNHMMLGARARWREATPSKVGRGLVDCLATTAGRRCPSRAWGSGAEERAAPQRCRGGRALSSGVRTRSKRGNRSAIPASRIEGRGEPTRAVYPEALVIND